MIKKFLMLILTVGFVTGIASGCSNSASDDLTLDEKHAPLPDYVLNSSEIVQETYVMATKYPEVVASVPCYCGCYNQDGHESNLDCFIDQMGPNNEVISYDPMSIA